MYQHRKAKQCIQTKALKVELPKKKHLKDKPYFHTIILKFKQSKMVYTVTFSRILSSCELKLLSYFSIIHKLLTSDCHGLVSFHKYHDYIDLQNWRSIRIKTLPKWNLQNLKLMLKHSLSIPYAKLLFKVQT